MAEIVANCTLGIDLHAGSHHRINLPHIRACLDNPETEKLAFAFGAPVILNADLREGSLRQAAEEKGMPMLLYEAGEALRFDEFAVRAGAKGVLAVMRSIGMLTSRGTKKSRIQPMVAKSTSWVRAPKSGILRTQIALGRKIAVNQKIGEIADPFDEGESAVLSTAAGIVIGRTNLPLVHKGDALFHIASFDNTVAVSESLDNFQEEIGRLSPTSTGGKS
jgi:predicted deacylase